MKIHLWVLSNDASYARSGRCSWGRFARELHEGTKHETLRINNGFRAYDPVSTFLLSESANIGFLLDLRVVGPDRSSDAFNNHGVWCTVCILFPHRAQRVNLGVRAFRLTHGWKSPVLARCK